MRVLVLALVFSVNIAFAEVQKLDKEDFSANGMELRPSLADGADACSAFSRYGVFLSSYPYGAPVARIWVDPIAVLPKMYPVVTNEAEEQLDSVLVIDFRPPVQKVGLTLNADPAQGVSIQAIGAGGEFLGELSATAGPFGTFVGLEDVDGLPISKVIIDYGSAEMAERLAAITVQRPATPQFETVLPQIAHARADVYLHTIITIVNVSNTRAEGEVRFYDPAGRPLFLEFYGASHHDNAVEFDLKPNSTKVFSTRGNADIAGYARVVSSAPVQAIAHFIVTGNNGEWSETAVPAVEARFEAVGAFSRQYFPLGGAISPDPPSIPPVSLRPDCALALVNLAAEPASIRLTLRDEAGSHAYETIELAPTEQYSRFLQEIFDSLRAPRGTIRISSNRPIAAILIKTMNGLPESILPLSSLED